ncbi:MAG: hypothetical protein AAFP90_06690 [Planctomycetota bacterium]
MTITIDELLEDSAGEFKHSELVTADDLMPVSPPWTIWHFVFIACAIALVWWHMGDSESSDEDQTNDVIVEVDGQFALIVTPNDASTMTLDQAAAVNSTDTTSSAKSVGFKTLKVTRGENLVGADRVWERMREKAAKPPSVVLLRDRKLTTFEIVDKASTLSKIRGGAE